MCLSILVIDWNSVEELYFMKANADMYANCSLSAFVFIDENWILIYCFLYKDGFLQNMTI